MKKCVKCGASLENDAMFCVVCGTKVQPAGYRCPHCGAPIEEDCVFCTACGGKIGQPNGYTPVIDAPNKGNNNRMIWYIIGGVLGGLLMVAASYLGYQKFSNRGEDVETVFDGGSDEEAVGDMEMDLYGSVANYLITMHLYFDGNDVDGNYYYDRRGPNETLSLNGTYKDGKLDLYETDASGRQTGHFDGYYDGVEYKGIFINRDGKRMSFILNDTPPASAPATTTPAPSTDPDAQFVKVTGVNVRLRTTPSINDNNIIKDARGKNVHPYKGERLKYVSEEDEFYLVIYRGDYVYISKQFAVLE